MDESNPYQASHSREFLEQATDKEPLRIGGWLILVLIGLIASPVRVGVALADTHAPMFSNGTWQTLTTPGSPSYHPLWGPLISLEIAGNVIILALALIILCFFFMKSRLTPRLVISWLIFALVFVVADLILAEQIPLIAAQPADPESKKELIRTIITVAIWVPYFLVSKRVKATFIEEWPNKMSKAMPLRSAP